MTIFRAGCEAYFRSSARLNTQSLMWADCFIYLLNLSVGNTECVYNTGIKEKHMEFTNEIYRRPLDYMYMQLVIREY